MSRVLAVIAELGYRRNFGARPLVTTAGLFVRVARAQDYDAATLTVALGHVSDQGVEGMVVLRGCQRPSGWLGNDKKGDP